MALILFRTELYAARRIGRYWSLDGAARPTSTRRGRLQPRRV